MDAERAELEQTFFNEAAEHLESMEQALLLLEHMPDDDEQIARVFRGAHSIKGACGFFGLPEIGAFTHSFESVLARARDHELPASAAFVAVSLRAVDSLRALLDHARGGGPRPSGIEDVAQSLRDLLGQGVRDSHSPARPELHAGQHSWSIRFNPEKELFSRGLNPLAALRELATTGDLLELEADLSRLPPATEMNPEQAYIGWRIRLRTSQTRLELEEVFAFYPCELVIEAETDAAPPPTATARAVKQGALDDASTLRVSIEKVDKLMDLAGELVIAQSIITQLANDFTMERLPLLQAATLELQRHARELQERVMAVRMVPIARLFGRLPRLVHDLSDVLGKKVRLELSGVETEIDKGVSEQLGDPLLHLVRNALDHGLEPPAERVAKGKPEQCVLRVAATQRGSTVIVEVTDDGRGLNLPRIRERAVAAGLIPDEASLEPNAIMDLLFLPGFSTAGEVTELSGRGVGLDVVKRNITALGGTVRVESAPSGGTSFSFELPLTLSIIDGVFVGVGEETYVLPLAAIVESFHSSSDRLVDVFGRNQVVVVRGRTIPAMRLDRFFGLEREVAPANEIVVLIESRGKQLALVVDRVIGQSSIVLKSLEASYRQVEGIGGATITGEGRVALVLDAHALVHRGQVAPNIFAGRPSVDVPFPTVETAR